MNESHVIEHQGLVERITKESIFVKILSQSACNSCNAKGACSVSEMKEKEIEVQGQSDEFKVGEMVNLILKQSQGNTAVLVAYIYPFLLVFSTLLITTSLGLGELKAGLISLAVLLPYFIIIYAMKNRIRKKFTFSIRKAD